MHDRPIKPCLDVLLWHTCLTLAAKLDPNAIPLNKDDPSVKQSICNAQTDLACVPQAQKQCLSVCRHSWISTVSINAQSAAGCSFIVPALSSTLLLLQAEKRSSSPWIAISSRACRAQLVLAIAMPFFQMATGINAVVFFSPQLFEGIGSFGEGAKRGFDRICCHRYCTGANSLVEHVVMPPL